MELRLIDAANIFRGIAGSGSFSPFHFLKDDKNQIDEPKKLISEGASWMIQSSLSDDAKAEIPVVYFTAATWLHKDTWAIAITPNYTVAVWIGNFDGRKRDNISNEMSARNLAEKTIKILGGKSSFFSKPQNQLKKIATCEKSGFAYQKFCKKQSLSEIPTNVVELKKCTIHKDKKKR